MPKRTRKRGFWLVRDGGSELRGRTLRGGRVGRGLRLLMMRRKIEVVSERVDDVLSLVKLYV